MKSLYKT